MAQHVQYATLQHTQEVEMYIYLLTLVIKFFSALHLGSCAPVHEYQATLVCFADYESDVAWELLQKRMIFLW